MKELSNIQKLMVEYDERFAQWQAKQSPLERSTDKLQATTAKLEGTVNESIFNRMNPFNKCGKFDLRFMEETFGFTQGRTMYAHGKLSTEEQIDALRKHNEEDFGQHNPKDEIG